MLFECILSTSVVCPCICVCWCMYGTCMSYYFAKHMQKFIIKWWSMLSCWAMHTLEKKSWEIITIHAIIHLHKHGGLVCTQAYMPVCTQVPTLMPHIFNIKSNHLSLTDYLLMYTYPMQSIKETEVYLFKNDPFWWCMMHMWHFSVCRNQIPLITMQVLHIQEDFVHMFFHPCQHCMQSHGFSWFWCH